ncbi:MAG: response regulator, partial [Microthrixaceae bacterium]
SNVRQRGNLGIVSTSTPQIILVATDADEVFDGIDAALADSSTQVARVTAGREVLAAVRSLEPSLVVLDLQIGNMGGVATCMGLRNEESFGRIDTQKILILLDRSADVFIAGQSGADGWLVKPLNSLRVSRAAQQVLSGGSYTEGKEPALEMLPATAESS